MGLILRYVQNTKTAKRYRRRVPERLQPFMEITEFTRFLGLTEREALRAYPGIHAECEKEFDLAEGKASGNPTEDAPKIPTTEFDQYRALITELRARAADPEKEAYDLDDPAGEVEWNTRSRAADAILDEYPIDPETGDPVGVTAADLALVRALNWKAPPPPPPTFEDATRRYIKDKGLDKDGSDKNRERVDRVARHVRAALGRDLPLPRLRRQDAREVMDYMLDDAGITSPATVERYLNDVRAIINHAIVEFDLSTYKNPFTKLNPPTKGPAKNARNPFTEKQLTAAHARVVTRASHDLQLIWRILAGTGCRLAEVSGLRACDVVLDTELPHIVVEWHEDRRIKTMVSHRKVPLVGDAFEAAREALQQAPVQAMLFPRYGKQRGPGRASAALMKHVRKVVADPKVVVHSLRHNMKDRLRLVGVPKNVQDEILGHTSGGIGEGYGGDEARLRVATEAMKKALGVT